MSGSELLTYSHTKKLFLPNVPHHKYQLQFGGNKHLDKLWGSLSLIIQYIIRSCSNSKPYTPPLLHCFRMYLSPGYLWYPRNRPLLPQDVLSTEHPKQSFSQMSHSICHSSVQNSLISYLSIKPKLHAVTYRPAIIFFLYSSDVTASFSPHCSLCPQGHKGILVFSGPSYCYFFCLGSHHTVILVSHSFIFSLKLFLTTLFPMVSPFLPVWVS